MKYCSSSIRFAFTTTRQKTLLDPHMRVVASSSHLYLRPPLLTPRAGESGSNVDLESPESQGCPMMLAFEPLAAELNRENWDRRTWLAVLNLVTVRSLLRLVNHGFLST